MMIYGWIILVLLRRALPTKKRCHGMARHNNHPFQLVHNDIPASLLSTTSLPCPAPPCLALPIEKVTWQGRMQQRSILICAKQLAKCNTINLFRLCKRLPKHRDECLRVNHKSCFCCVMSRPQKRWYGMAWHGGTTIHFNLSTMSYQFGYQQPLSTALKVVKVMLWIMGEITLVLLKKDFHLNFEYNIILIMDVGFVMFSMPKLFECHVDLCAIW